MSPKFFLSLDLEMAQPSGLVIQVGACVGNIETGEIVDTFQVHVKIDEPISEYITKLTGITDEQNKAGITLVEAYKRLAEMHDKWECFRNPVQWGQGDAQELRDQIECEVFPSMTFNVHNPYVFGRRALDVKTLFQARQLARGEKLQAGLAKALTKCGLQFEGRKHTACADSVNTFRLFYHLIKEQSSPN